MRVLSDGTILACQKVGDRYELSNYDIKGKLLRGVAIGADCPNDIVEVVLDGTPCIAMSFW